MTMRDRKWLAPALAALAVLAVVVVAAGVWALRPGADDVGVTGAGSGAGQGAPPYAGTQPGSPGAPDGSEPVPDGAGGTPDVDPGRIAVDTFYRYDGRHLALNYYNGVPECYGTAGTPTVEERADVVVVTIPRSPARSSKDTACIDIALAGSVEVTLDAPLGGRAVLDGGRDELVVEEASSRYQSDQVR